MGSLGTDTVSLFLLLFKWWLFSVGFLNYLIIFFLVVHCRWNRLESLLVQGSKDRDFSAKDALQPVLKLLLGPDGEELRTLVVKEAVRVTEAFIWGTAIDTYNSMPEFMKGLIVNGNAIGPLAMSVAEQESMIALRDQVIRIWGLLRTSESFDPAILQPILQVRALFAFCIFSYVCSNSGWKSCYVLLSCFSRLEFSLS